MTETTKTFDAVIIGAGPGGYVAAIRAAQLGLKVALVEEKHLGGVCLNWGCIPTKALLRTSELYHTISHADEFGIKVENLSFDFEKIIERSRAVSKQLAQGVQHLLKKNKVTVVNGRGRLSGKTADGLHRVEVSVEGKVDSTVASKNIVIATGARARSLPGLEPDGDVIWTAKEAMVPEKMPNSLLVIGSGAIGIEFASFYNALGCKVTVVEVQDRILPVEDAEISKFARKAFEKQGMTFLTSATVEKLDVSKNKVRATVKTAKGSSEHVFDKAIVAVGILGNTENLGLESTKAVVERNQIQVNKWCQTHEQGIYAIGDVAGAPWLAHKASHEGVMVAEKMAALETAHPVDKKAIPGCTYSNPQIASIGLTEDKARAEGYDIKVGRFPFIGNGKAIALGETDGMMKTIFDAKTGAFLGAHLVGTEVTEMIQGFVIALTLEATEAELMQTVFPHPTLSEMMHESTLDAYDRAIHM
ncbi:MAG: dihydrolipoyl dehydrogenase [Alphaproteobacteria bacterium]|nr:dihydrolipoyl dehydrogenase [Alphaproteobacteria bacterium]NCQ66429.1 dihydrolipoyl dehydrogenase [Alphaproteobacteria bacterium]